MNESDIEAPAVADYIADLSKELSAMARSARMDLLAYLLEMATDEAKARSRDRAEPMTPPKNGQHS
jgi:hypothetical protein